MSNLLPPHARKAVIVEYWTRVITIWSFMLVFGILAVGLLLLPTYRLMESQLEYLLAQKQEVLAVNGSETNAAETIVKDTNALAAALASEDVSINLSQIIDAVNASAGDGVTIRAYEVNRTGTAVESFQIQGVAASREILANFKTALEEQALFKSAEMPISDLVRGTNLPFAITVYIADTFNQ